MPQQKLFTIETPVLKSGGDYFVKLFLDFDRQISELRIGLGAMPVDAYVEPRKEWHGNTLVVVFVCLGSDLAFRQPFKFRANYYPPEIQVPKVEDLIYQDWEVRPRLNADSTVRTI